jgi:hypothetical protein
MIRPLPADLTFPDVRRHMAAYLRAGYKTRRNWTIVVPLADGKERWGEVVFGIWLEVRAEFKAFDLRLHMEDLLLIGDDRVLLLVGVRRIT